ncbi:MAG: uroporphyrinogen decarboxylase family protein [Bacteroidia bacterium]|nr:uroporphyrinogen decarboxylase family protein [Bacteroidia bacterium]
MFLLEKAIYRQNVPRVPVWMMRQAGRTDPEYRAYKVKDPRPLEQLFRDVQASVTLSLLPQRIGVDAIIFYQDILTVLEHIGFMFHFNPGPTLAQPINSKKDIENIQLPEQDLSVLMPYIPTTIKLLQQQLKDTLPVLGFAGAPMTLTAFLFAGKSPTTIEPLLQMARLEPDALHLLQQKLTQLTISYLNLQLDSGVLAVQIFESLADKYPRDFYEKFVQPYHQQIFDALKHKNTILFCKECTYLDLMVTSGAKVISVGKCLDIGHVANICAKHGLAFQGNVDNQILHLGSRKDVEKAVKECIAKSGKIGHILNLNHGLIRTTPFENILAFVEAAKSLS